MSASRATAPLRVAVLCSHRAPALRFVLEHNADHGPRYNIVACVSSEAHCADASVVHASSVPFFSHPIRQHCSNLGTIWTDRTARLSYDLATAQILHHYEPDVVMLDAYLYLLSDAMLSRYPRRIINLHHSDLLRLDRSGRPLFVGLRAVRDAIAAGETHTRATAHLVTRDLDAGPALLRSWAFPVSPLVNAAQRWNAADMVKAYDYAHQEWMIRSTWGPLMVGTLTLVADGRVDLDTLTGDPEQVWSLDESGAVVPPCPQYAETLTSKTVPFRPVSARGRLTAEERR